jgi:hypothetical protein
MNAQLPSRSWLLAHPDAAGEWVWSIGVEAQLTATAITCRYALRGDLAHVRVMAATGAQRADGLWRHTCFEAFVASPHGPGYYEFNFSPSLSWAAYRFADYRAGMSAPSLTRAPELQVRRTAAALDLTATVQLAGLAPLESAAALRIALAAVIEEDDGRLSYWALRHPSGNPDFHHPESFALELRPA